MAEMFKQMMFFETVKLVTVRNWKLGLINRLIQFAVILYIALYAIWIQKGYQKVSPVEGVLYVKVKGAAVDQYGKVYDSSDLVVPATESNALFITTRALDTVQTENGICTDPDKKCSVDSDCVFGTSTLTGITQPTCNTTVGRCLIKGWCPQEDESLPLYEFSGIQNWTIFMRSHVTYTAFKDVHLNNADAVKMGYNIFPIKQMIDNSNWTDVSLNGAVINVLIDWSCNLDAGQDKCKPKFRYTRVDTQSTSSSRGFNFRYATYGSGSSFAGNTDTRTLYKVYGTRFLFQTTGRGAQADVFATIVTLGSAAAFFSVASITTDFVLQYIHPHREAYDQAKRQPLDLNDESNEASGVDYVKA